MGKRLYVWPILVMLSVIACPLALADIPVEVYEYAPDPGQPPERMREVPLAFVAVSLVCVAIAVVFVIRANLRGKIQWRPTMLCLFAISLITVVGLAVALRSAPPSEEYQQWQEAHRKWQNKEKVFVGYELDSPEQPIE